MNVIDIAYKYNRFYIFELIEDICYKGRKETIRGVGINDGN